ncbi:MAG: DNA repair protein RadA, partial [Dehalococcoidales bacterium]|nr:DNA repair protein RadA [Dehalococcoidales bacterium]
EEPAADLGMALAIVSSHRDSPVIPDTVVAGEVGLSGEIRAVRELERRLGEAARLGFRHAIVPRTNARINPPAGLEVIAVSTLREAVSRALQPPPPQEND